MPTDVLVLGSVNRDLIVHAPRLPVPGETLRGQRFASSLGGKGANQAVAAARLGALAADAGLKRMGVMAHSRLTGTAQENSGPDADRHTGERVGG